MLEKKFGLLKYNRKDIELFFPYIKHRIPNTTERGRSHVILKCFMQITIADILIYLLHTCYNRYILSITLYFKIIHQYTLILILA